jgi:LmbE family N-acetylglucosaminyl deacetylase
METLDVIAVGAHPDDCEIGCGGTLAALVYSGLKVGIIDLTDGEPTPGSPSPEVRIAEAHAAAEKLGISKRVILNLPNRRLFDSFETRVALAKQFRIFKPRLIIGLGEKTPMASPDHWQAAQITDAAVFYSRLSKWDEHFDGLPVHTIERQIYYSLMLESGVMGSGPKQFVHDITDFHQQKIAAIKCYATQFPATKAYVFDKVRAMDSIAGVAAGFGFGEVFTSTKSVGSRDLFATLQLNDAD